MGYEKSDKYTDLETIYAQCSGPGGLKLTEFLAERLDLRPGMRLLDIGTNYGYQTCFLAKEYGVFAVGIDPWVDPFKGSDAPSADHVTKNAESMGVADQVLAIRVGVPDTKFADNSFDVAYSTTTFEMIRGMSGEGLYKECLSETLRVLRPGALFGYGDPMHFDVEIPPDLVPHVTRGDPPWADCFVTISETVESIQSVGFEIVEADYAPDARLWWEEFCKYDASCIADPDGDPETIRVDDGRWVSFGYVIARKPL